MNAPSKQQVKVVVDGKTYTVEVEDAMTSPTTVTVNGKPYQVDVHSVASTTQVPTATVSAPAAIMAPPPAAPVVSAAPSSNEVRAPMPGTVLDIQVKVGDQVASAQELCFLEAMKMKNAIRANRAATITSVEVSEGQSVAHGQVLFTFE